MKNYKLPGGINSYLFISMCIAHLIYLYLCALLSESRWYFRWARRCL